MYGLDPKTNLWLSPEMSYFLGEISLEKYKEIKIIIHSMREKKNTSKDALILLTSEKDLLNEKNTIKTSNSYYINSDVAIFKMFSEFFNFVKQKTMARKSFKITDIHFNIGGRPVDYLYLGDSLGSSLIVFKFKGIDLQMYFNSYKRNSEINYEINLSPEYPISEEIADLYKELLEFTIKMSNLKGNYFKFDDDSISWKILELEKRNFDDIFLPDSQLEDIKLFVNIFKKTGKMLRYLFSGNPGTCKTESTLVIANELKSIGVTIIKMNPTDYLVDKIKLAELLAPSLIIFDDIDLNLGSRQHGSFSRNLKNFLDIFDGTEKLKSNVGVIATSNSVDLLDLAARRPGRFDRILSFDELTTNNVKDIIIKSLKYNFDTIDELGVYTNSSIVDLFFKEKVTGAHIYNTIKSLKLRSDINEIEVTKAWLMEEVKKDISTINSIKRISKDKLGTTAGIGYQFNNNEDEEIVVERKRARQSGSSNFPSYPTVISEGGTQDLLDRINSPDFPKGILREIDNPGHPIDVIIDDGGIGERDSDTTEDF